MSATDHCEDPEPSGRPPAGLLFVPVRPGPAGCTARYFRTPLGDRTAVAFTSAAGLAGTLGADHACIRLSEPALRALAAPLGITALTLDPQLSAPPVPATTPSPAVTATATATGVAGRPGRTAHPPRPGAPRASGAAVAVTHPAPLIG
ncbi:SAV_915 family protein [Streptomyces sp. MMBL 11-3]|uniref:SAV_915 family protein n=1 Tax=Streptomyces sp. MMBL 11-3 TaxID=3382639 RepID=UPI0039B686EC